MPAARPVPAERPAPPWRRNLTILWWAQFLAVAGMAQLLPFLPLLIRELGVGDAAQVQRWSGAVFSAPFLCSAVMTPVWGWLGDRFGRKLMVVRALLGLAACIFLMSFARTPLQLLALRLLQGLVSGFIPAAIALVSATAPRDRQGWALGTLSSAQAAGVVAGPLLGGVLADLLGFRSLFRITAALELVAALVVIMLVHESRDATRAGSGPRPSLRMNLALAWRWPVRLALGGLLLTQMTLLLVQPFFALFVESLGVGADRLSTTTGVLFGVTGLTMFASAALWGRLSDRYGRRRTLSLAFLSGGIILLLQGWTRRVETLFVLRALQGVFAAGMLPGLYAIVAHHSPAAYRGGVMGFGSSATLLGGLLGPLTGGFLAASFGMRPAFTIAATLFGIATWMAWRLPPDRGPRPVRARRSWELPSQ